MGKIIILQSSFSVGPWNLLVATKIQSFPFEVAPWFHYPQFLHLESCWTAWQWTSSFPKSNWKTSKWGSLKLGLQFHRLFFHAFVACSWYEKPRYKRAGTSSGSAVVQGNPVMGKRCGRCSCTQPGSLHVDALFEKACKTQPYAHLIRQLPHLLSWRDWKLSQWFHHSIGHWKEKWIGRWSSFYKDAIIIKISCAFHCFV